MLFIIAIITFIGGFMLGSYIRTVSYDQQDWQVLRWSRDVLGYRPAIEGSYVKRDDNIIMALKLNTSDIPNDAPYHLESD